jgi:lysylphosphatidylglycerol synthetase-like protein (DUF2156 family)
VFTGIVPLAIRTGATSVAALAGLGTLLVAGGLARRQRRAWWIALTLLTIGGLSHVVKDLDVPEAVLNLTLAFVLLSYRREFDARTGRVRSAGRSSRCRPCSWSCGGLASSRSCRTRTGSTRIPR